MDNTSNESIVPQDNEYNQLPFEFIGDGTEYFKIWIVNILLSIITLGIYSAWATVRNNRYIYSNLYLGENNFRYLAEPIPILKSRIIAVALLVIFSFASQSSPQIAIGLAALMFIAIPYFVNKSVAFNYRMSAFKNIQFRFKASYREAFLVLYVWPILGILSLGILYPMALLKMNQFLVGNASYGTTKFTFNATYADYGKIFLTIIGVGVVVGIPTWAIAVYIPQLAFIPPVVMIAVYFGLFVFFMVSTTNLFYRSMAIASHKFEANLNMVDLSKVILINLFLTVLTLGLYLPAAKVRMLKYICSCMVMQANGSLDNFTAAEAENVSAIGEELGQAFDFGV